MEIKMDTYKKAKTLLYEREAVNFADVADADEIAFFNIENLSGITRTSNFYILLKYLSLMNRILFLPINLLIASKYRSPNQKRQKWELGNVYYEVRKPKTGESC